MISEDYDWPGWPLSGNPHGEEFDIYARKRMIAGSEQLLPLLEKYSAQIGDFVLEVGPFFNPLITPERFPSSHIFYWENDYHVIKYLKNNYKKKGVYPVFCDLNKIDGISFLKLKMDTKNYFRQLKSNKISFDSVVVSHVFNYVDYRLFLMMLKEFVKPDGLIFINNVVDYGLPAFFSEKRPKSIAETLKVIEEAGYEIINKKVIDSPDKVHQENKRLVLVAKRNER